MNHRITSAVVAFSLFACLPRYALAQPEPPAEPGRPIGQDAVSVQLKRKSGPSLSARLIEVQRKAQEKSATVSVRVYGIKLIDPDSVDEIPAKGQGHLHYRLDSGPIIATTATKLSFHELSSGHHSIAVNLAANNHSPIGPTRILDFTIP